MVIVMRKLLYGVGLDDTSYQKSKKINGISFDVCPIYAKWQNMLCRCYNSAYKLRHPSYNETSVCSEWLVFSAFKAWVELQSWDGRELDKDLLDPSSKEYNKESCCFISGKLNKFIVTRKASSEGLPVGVGLDKRDGTYAAYCNNPLINKKERIGTFSDPIEAHLAWKKRKLQFAIELGSLEPDKRVLPALIKRYS
jgi:hypothetical protein